MENKAIEIFATQSDLFQLLDMLEGQRSIDYVLTGLFNENIVQRFNTVHDIDDFGFSIKGDQNHDPIFLIIDKHIPIEVEKVQQRRGGVKFAVDQSENPKSIAFVVGGEYKDVAIIAGQIGTTSNDSDSVNLFKLISKEVRKQFKKIKAYYVGKNAIMAMNNGVRLTASIQAPTNTDLRQDSR